MGFRIVGLLGSPLAGGNTAKLLDQALLGARDAGCGVERIDVYNLTFSPCREIFYCREHGTCAMKDDMIPLYRTFAELDSLIVATPVMTMGIPGALKSFMDRFQVFFMAKYMRGRPLVPEEKRAHRRGLYIGISGMNVPHVFDGAKLTMKAFFSIIDVEYWDELLTRDMDTIRDITTRPDVMDEAYRKGFRLGELLFQGEP
ncbi:MAG: flavodoxin family protein [Methanolinea sp.]|nr:flavodoxin family protein [Methanolinea sp.]